MAFWHLSSPPECWSEEENSPMVNLTFPNKLEGRLASHGRYECGQRHQYLVMTNAAASIINSIILLSHTSAFWCEQCTGEFNSIQSDHSSHLLNYHGMQRLTAQHSKALIALLHRKPIFQMLLSLMRSLTVLCCIASQSSTIARSVWGLSNVWEMIFRSVRNRNRAQSWLGSLEAGVETPQHSSFHFFSTPP